MTHCEDVSYENPRRSFRRARFSIVHTICSRLPSICITIFDRPYLDPRFHNGMAESLSIDINCTAGNLRDPGSSTRGAALSACYESQSRVGGCTSMRDLLLALPRDPIEKLIKRDLISVPSTMDKEEVVDLMGRDPAQWASIFLTTVTEIVGFASFLGFAVAFSSLLLSRLGGIRRLPTTLPNAMYPWPQAPARSCRRRRPSIPLRGD